MINIGNVKYYINIDEVFRLVSHSDRTERKETEITDAYEYDSENCKLSPVNKMVREIKSPSDPQTDNIRYDFIKFLISEIIDTKYEDFDFGSNIVFNTLIKKGILVKVKTEGQIEEK